MAVSSSALTWAQQRWNWRKVYQFVRLVVRRFGDDRGLQTASALTYTTLLSLIPLLVVSLAILSGFGSVSDMHETVKDAVLGVLVPASEAQMAAQFDRFLGNAKTLTAPGLAAVAVTAIMTLFTIESTFNRIWQVASPRSLALRILRFWAVLTLGPLLLGASLSLTSYFFAVADEDILGGAARVLSRLAPLALQWLAFTLLYIALPNTRVRFHHAALGGLVAAVLFEALKLGFAVYVDNADNFRVIYGALAAIPIFLMWLYTSWTVILIGAEVTAALPQWQRERAEQLMAERVAAATATARLVAALTLLQQMWNRAADGESLSRDAPEALKAVWAGNVLETLEEHRFVAETTDGELMLGRDLSRTSVLTLWQTLDFGTPSLDPDMTILSELRMHERELLQQPLSQFLTEWGEEA